MLRRNRVAHALKAYEPVGVGDSGRLEKDVVVAYRLQRVAFDRETVARSLARHPMNASVCALSQPLQSLGIAVGEIGCNGTARE